MIFLAAIRRTAESEAEKAVTNTRGTNVARHVGLDIFDLLMEVRRHDAALPSFLVPIFS